MVEDIYVAKIRVELLPNVLDITGKLPISDLNHAQTFVALHTQVKDT